MSDRDRVLAWFASGALVRPDASQPGTVDLAGAIAHLCGGPGAALTQHARGIVDAIGAAQHLVFVLVDGLGMNLVERLPTSSFLRSQVVMELQAVFPSSTAPALTSLATGLWPAQHAVPGWFTYLPDNGLTTMILPFVERYSKRPLEALGVDPARALPSPSLLASFTAEACSYQPRPITNSVYSNYFTGGTPQKPYERLDDAAAAIPLRIAASKGPTYSYLYVPVVDAAEHDHGPYAKQAQRALAAVERSLQRLAARLDRRTRLVVTADHGLVDVAPEHAVELRGDDTLLTLLRVPPFGEPRVPSFLAHHEGRDEFATAFRARFGETHALLTIDEVDELRLFGPEALALETRRRLGDFMAISATPDAIVYRPEHPMRGHHGGLLPDEMRIPLIVA